MIMKKTDDRANDTDQMTPDIDEFVVFVKKRIPVIRPRLMESTKSSFDERFAEERRNLIESQRIERHVLKGHKGSSSTPMKTLKAVIEPER